MTHPLSEDQISSLRSKLETRRGELRAELQQKKTTPERLESDSQDIEASYASDVDQQVDEGLDAQHTVELRDIEAALKRIESGQYGVCQDCGGGIDSERLSVYPTARRCIECKQVFEKQSGVGR